MDATHLLDLFAAEAQEHLHLLQGSLLRLEHQPDGAALHEAFRAAHTIKGLAAAMGYQEVAERAHSLEDALAALRQGDTDCTPALLDALLGRSDELQRGVARVVAERPPLAPQFAPELEREPTLSVPIRPIVPAGTSHVVEVVLQREAPFKAARALVILRAIRADTRILGWAPDPLPANFDGTLFIFLDGHASADLVQARVRAAGDVASVTVAGAGDEGTLPATAGATAPGTVAEAGPRERQVRVGESVLDQLADGVGELSVLRHRLSEANLAGAAGGMVERMGQLLAELQRVVLAMRMVPLREVFDRLPRVVRDACRRSGRDAELQLQGEDVELDRAILGEIGDPLAHLLRNAVAHGIEDAEARARAGKPRRGRVTVRAEREHDGVSITVQDDGAGVDRVAVRQRAEQAGLLPDRARPLTDEDLLRLLARPGFTLVNEVTGVSGRGVGLDAALTGVRSLGGAVELQTVAGEGTSFRIKLPVTLALTQALRVRVGGEEYAIPLTHLRETLDLAGALLKDGERELVLTRGQPVPLLRLRRLLQSEVPGREASAVVAQVGERWVALAVDELVGHERILVKSIDPVPGTLPVFTGATLLADGRPALVLDPLALVSE